MMNPCIFLVYSKTVTKRFFVTCPAYMRRQITFLNVVHIVGVVLFEPKFPQLLGISDEKDFYYRIIFAFVESERVRVISFFARPTTYLNMPVIAHMNTGLLSMILIIFRLSSGRTRVQCPSVQVLYIPL